MRSFKRCSGLLLILVLLGLPNAVSAQKPTSFERSSLTITDDRGTVHRFDVEIARSAEQLAFGLMFRSSLPRNAGMLFDYGRPQRVSMWMKNTLIPLDMIFIDAQGRIVTIAERAVPRSLRTINSGKVVRGVLELNGGTVSRLKIRVGDIVRHDIFEGD